MAQTPMDYGKLTVALETEWNYFKRQSDGIIEIRGGADIIICEVFAPDKVGIELAREIVKAHNTFLAMNTIVTALNLRKDRL